MSSRGARTFVVSLLLIVGAAGAYLGFEIYQQHTSMRARERTTLSQLDDMLASVNELAVTQRGYFEPSRGATGSSAPQFQRVRQLTEELKEHLASLRSQMTAPEALDQLTSLSAALDDFSTTDTRVRTNLANDTFFSAADLVFSASATELRSVTSGLLSLKQLTSTAAVVAYDNLQRRAALVIAVVASVWTLGLLVLAWRPSHRTEPLPTVEVTPLDPVEARVIPPASVETESEPVAAQTTVDLDVVAAVCAAMAKAGSAAELREVMAEAASAVSASGMVVWLGAGEELFPVLGHGYDARMLARIGPISRHAANATALAWRTVAPQVVPGDQGRAGAVVVPLVSAQGCIGVLSAEVQSGRESDAVTRSVTMLFAAQLSTIVAAWPEPSAGAVEDRPTHTGTIAVTL